MNIWMLNHYATPPDTPGITRHYDLARELIKRGHRVTLFAAGFSHRTRREERLKGKEKSLRQNIDGVDFVWLRTPPYFGGNDRRRVKNMLSYSWRVIPAALSLKEKPDIVLASSPHPFAGLAGWFLARWKRARFFFEVRDLWPQTLIDIGGYSPKSLTVRLLKILEKFLYRRARKTIVLHPKASDYITGLGIPGDKIVFIPNGVNPDLFAAPGTELPAELAEIISGLKAKGKLLAGYTGAHGIANALDTIIETARLLQERKVDKLRFLMVGDGPEKERLVAQAEKYGLKNLSFYRSIAKGAMPALLRNLDFAVLSWKKSDLYTKYGMSTNKLWDYMMCAKPIVWAIDTAVNPVAEAGCGITVVPEDPEAMAQAVMKLCEMSQPKRREMGTRGYEYVMKYHSTPILTDRLLEAIGDTKPL
jgi:glycosyltransferase involved in cell wall biosynthesis